jgi:hypothetical protein
MTARKKPEPVLIHVRYEFGPLSLEADVPALRVSATIDAMVNVHRAAVKKHPECLPELGSVTSSMAIPVDDEPMGEGDTLPRRRRVGFTA